jgi:hypothetical protein
MWTDGRLLTMSNLFYPTDDESEQPATDGLSMWDEVRQVADEIEVKIHLAGMDARDRWRALERRLPALQTDLASSGARASQALKKEMSAICAALRELRADLLGGSPHR